MLTSDVTSLLCRVDVTAQEQSCGSAVPHTAPVRRERAQPQRLGGWGQSGCGGGSHLTLSAGLWGALTSLHLQWGAVRSPHLASSVVL